MGRWCPPCLYPPPGYIQSPPSQPKGTSIRRGAHAPERGRARRQQHYSGGDLASPLQMLGLARPRQHKAGPGRAGPKRERGWYGGGRQGKDGQGVQQGEWVQGAAVTGSCWVGDASVALWHHLALPQGCPEPGVPPLCTITYPALPICPKTTHGEEPPRQRRLPGRWWELVTEPAPSPQPL